MTDEYLLPEEEAAEILQAALNEGRSAEFLACLFSGGSAGIEQNGSLILYDGDLIAALADAENWDPEDERIKNLSGPL